MMPLNICLVEYPATTLKEKRVLWVCNDRKIFTSTSIFVFLVKLFVSVYSLTKHWRKTMEKVKLRWMKNNCKLSVWFGKRS